MKATEDKKIALALKSAQVELQRFFGIKVGRPKVVLVSSRAEYNKLSGRKTEEWMVAQMKDNTIYIFHPKLFAAKYNLGDPQRFWKILKHEYAHLFYRALTHTNQPRWLHEGLACYLAKQEKKVPTKEHLVNLQHFFNWGGEQVYGVGYFWVGYLIKKYGKAKLLKLVKAIDAKITKKKFEAKFKQIYGFGLGKRSLSQKLR